MTDLSILSYPEMINIELIVSYVYFSESVYAQKMSLKIPLTFIIKYMFLIALLSPFSLIKTLSKPGFFYRVTYNEKTQ